MQNLPTKFECLENGSGKTIDGIIRFDDLTVFLQRMREQSSSSKLWVYNLVRSMLYMMLFDDVERLLASIFICSFKNDILSFCSWSPKLCALGTVLFP